MSNIVEYDRERKPLTDAQLDKVEPNADVSMEDKPLEPVDQGRAE